MNAKTKYQPTENDLRVKEIFIRTSNDMDGIDQASANETTQSDMDNACKKLVEILETKLSETYPNATFDIEYGNYSPAHNSSDRMKIYFENENGETEIADEDYGDYESDYRYIENLIQDNWGNCW